MCRGRAACGSRHEPPRRTGSDIPKHMNDESLFWSVGELIVSVSLGATPRSSGLVSPMGRCVKLVPEASLARLEDPRSVCPLDPAGMQGKQISQTCHMENAPFPGCTTKKNSDYMVCAVLWSGFMSSQKTNVFRGRALRYCFSLLVSLGGGCTSVCPMNGWRFHLRPHRDAFRRFRMAIHATFVCYCHVLCSSACCGTPTPIGSDGSLMHQDSSTNPGNRQKHYGCDFLFLSSGGGLGRFELSRKVLGRWSGCFGSGEQGVLAAQRWRLADSL